MVAADYAVFEEYQDLFNGERINKFPCLGDIN